MRGAVEAFVQGLNWVLEYYYRGVVSWGWFYPFHYSPMISDMTDLAGITCSFERGQPFSPYQQLLAVLPAASSKLLPKPLPGRCSGDHHTGAWRLREPAEKGP